MLANAAVHPLHTVRYNMMVRGVGLLCLRAR